MDLKKQDDTHGMKSVEEGVYEGVISSGTKLNDDLSYGESSECVDLLHELNNEATKKELKLWQYIERQYRQWQEYDTILEELRKHAAKVGQYVSQLEFALQCRDDEIKNLKEKLDCHYD